jgi:nicotinamidase-related amidase
MVNLSGLTAPAPHNKRVRSPKEFRGSTRQLRSFRTFREKQSLSFCALEETLEFNEGENMVPQKHTRRTRENTAVLLVDHQVGLFTGVRDLTVSDLKHNVVGLAKAAKVLGLPIVPVTTARDSMWGPTIPELKAVVGDNILDRSSVNAWDDARFVDAVKATKRDHLIIAGLSFEVCASFPAISAKEVGYEPIIALDACGTFSQDKRQAGIARLVTLGIEVSDYATLMMEILGDNADPKANDVYAALDMPFAVLMGQVAGALIK